MIRIISDILGLIYGHKNVEETPVPIRIIMFIVLLIIFVILPLLFGGEFFS